MHDADTNAVTAADDFLCALQQAAVSVGLYGHDHGVAVASAQEAAVQGSAVAASAAATHPSGIRVIHLNGRVSTAGVTLPSSDRLREGLFTRLSAAGVDTLTLAAGGVAPDAAALRALTAWLGQEAEPEGGAPPSAPGIEFGHLRGRRNRRDLAADVAGSVGADGDAGAAQSPGGFARQAAALLSAAHAGSPADAAARAAAAAGLAAMAGRICLAVSATADAVLPLTRLKSHDEYTFVHTSNVAILSVALAEAAGMPVGDVRAVGLAALLHDLGKTAVPLEILNKPGRLTDAEFDVIRSHPAIGMRQLLAMPGVPPLAAVVAYEHHMRCDGGGYPSRPAGYTIHPASHIVHIADVFDALATDRPYREGMPMGRIVDIFRDDAAAYDPALLDLFLDDVVYRLPQDLAMAA